MAYNPVGIEQFKTKLKSGQYTTLSNAKRAIGKAALSAQEKAECLRLAERHKFSGTPAQPARKPATAGKKKAKATAPKKAVKKAPRPVAKPATKTSKKKAAKKPPNVARKPTPQPDGRAKLDEQGARIGYLATSIEAMKKAKDINPEIDVGPGPQAACDALGAIISQMHSDIRQLEPQQPADQAVVDRLAKSAPVAQTASQEPAAAPPAPPGFEPGVVS